MQTEQIKWERIASGDYEADTAAGRVRIYRIPDLNPPAWNAHSVVDYSDPTVSDVEQETVYADGAATLRDAKEFVREAVAS